MRWWELFRQAMAGAARARVRSALTAMGVAIGCGALVSMIAFALGLQQRIEGPLKRLGMLNDVHVSAKEDRERDPEDADAAPIAHPPLDDAALAKFRAIRGVRYVYPDMSLHDVTLTRGEEETSVFALALPREVGASEQFDSMLVAGHFFSLDDAAEILVAQGLLDDLGFDDSAAALGQTVELSTKGLAKTDERGKFEYQEKSLRVRIVGVIQPPDFGGLGPRSLRRAILLPHDLLVQLPGLVESQMWRMRSQGTMALDSFASVTVRAENPGAVPRIAEAIREAGFEARTTLSRVEDMRVAFLFVESLLTAVGSVALVIAALGIANTLLMTVVERYEEIGLYKAIGATDGHVRLIFLAEAAVLGLVGSLGGLVLAAVVCWALQWGVNVHLANEGVERAADAFYFPWWLLVSAVAISTALSILSGLYPASRAARVDPIKALRRA